MSGSMALATFRRFACLQQVVAFSVGVTVAAANIGASGHHKQSRRRQHPGRRNNAFLPGHRLRTKHDEAIAIAPEPPAIAPISAFLSVGFISAPAASGVFANLEVQIRQIRKYGDDNAHQYADGIPLLRGYRHLACR